MIFDFTYYEPWHPPFGYRESLRGADNVEWMAPAEALKLLDAAGVKAPMPIKDLLVSMAASGSLISVARVVEEVEQGASDQGRYLDVPLSTEWALDEWRWEHADLWHDGTMRMTKSHGGALLTRTFQEIVFDRDLVEQTAARWRAADDSAHALLPNRSLLGAAEWEKWVVQYKIDHPVLPDVDRTIYKDARKEFGSSVTQAMCRKAFGGNKPGPR